MTWFERRRPARILNVDDNEIGLYTKTRILRQAGFEVIEAANGMDALQAVRTQHPDLVLLDLQLPDVDGFEVCRRIKSDPPTARLPVLHITATAGIAPDSEASSAESGADIFLQQPVEPQEIITVVRTLLRLRTTELGLAESEERLRLAIEGANIATWDIDLRDGSAHFSRELYGFLGRTPVGRPARWELWLDQIHADDRAAVTAGNGPSAQRPASVSHTSTASSAETTARNAGLPPMGVCIGTNTANRRASWALLSTSPRANTPSSSESRCCDWRRPPAPKQKTWRV